MKNKMGLISLVLLTACETPSGVNGTSLSSISSSDDSGSLAIVSANTVSMTQKFLYVMADGGIKAVPIDASTGDLIDTVTGNWWVKPATGTGNFYTMAMSPNGKMIYALLRNTSLQSKIYQYAVSDIAYSTYSTDRPLADSGTYAATNVVPGLFSYGNNGNLFLQNFNFSPTKVDMYTINGTTTKLSVPSTVGSLTTATSTYGLTFARVTQVGYDSHTYSIDTQTNRIIHYVDGVIQGSYDAGTQATLTDLALH